MEINETELRQIVYDAVRETIKKELGGTLVEARDRNSYLKTTNSLLKPITQHTLLVAYCSLYERDNLNFNHWKKEVVAFCSNITTGKIADVSVSNQHRVKEKILTQVFYTDNRININEMWVDLMDKKNIKRKMDNHLLEAYTDIIDDLVEYIKNGDMKNLENYVFSL
jgi:translation elongation factor EF-G